MSRNRLVSKMRKSVCVVWVNQGQDADGSNVYEEAIEMPCRWEDRIAEFVDEQRNVIQVSAVVYIDRAVELGSIMKHVSLASLTGAEVASETPERIAGASSVRVMQIWPNAQDNVNMYVVGL